jgi:hypothetical protein
MRAVDAQVKWRHVHFAAASLAITEQLERFRLMNRQAISHSTSKTANDGGDSQALDATAMRRLVNALPESEYVSVSAPKADVKAGKRPECIAAP